MDGPQPGLDLLRELQQSGRIEGNHYVPATEADLLRRAGRLEEAAAAYRSALGLVTNDAERRCLRRRLSEVC